MYGAHCDKEKNKVSLAQTGSKDEDDDAKEEKATKEATTQQDSKGGKDAKPLEFGKGPGFKTALE